MWPSPDRQPWHRTTSQVLGSSLKRTSPSSLGGEILQTEDEGYPLSDIQFPFLLRGRGFGWHRILFWIFYTKHGFVSCFMLFLRGRCFVRALLGCNRPHRTWGNTDVWNPPCSGEDWTLWEKGDVGDVCSWFVWLNEGVCWSWITYVSLKNTHVCLLEISEHTRSCASLSFLLHVIEKSRGRVGIGLETFSIFIFSVNAVLISGQISVF